LSELPPIEHDSHETDGVLDTVFMLQKTREYLGLASRSTMGGLLERFTSYRFETSADPSKSEAAL
jgi:hypothetical protein